MAFGTGRPRLMITALFGTLVALWTFAAYLTIDAAAADPGSAGTVIRLALLGLLLAAIIAWTVVGVRTARAVAELHHTAVTVADEQTQLRHDVRQVFLSLARRSQALLHRQLALLDQMERRTADSEELAELFQIDHLATRMRRNAANLIVLSGANPGRSWRRPVPMLDVVRAALAEVEEYTRVTLAPTGSTAVVGRAAGDLIHLLAELIENAVTFSPPQTVVRVGGSAAGGGYAVEIEDRGLGMSDDARAAANAGLGTPTELPLAGTGRLGLHVVATLAARHGIRVHLTESAVGGTTAIVRLPDDLLVGPPADDGPPEGAPTTGRVRRSGDAARSAGPVAPTGLPVRQRRPSDRERTPTGADAGVRPSTAAPIGSTAGPVTAGGPGSGPLPLPGLSFDDIPPARAPAEGRRLDEMREQLSAYRAGSQRGRRDAARTGGPDPDGPDGAGRGETNPLPGQEPLPGTGPLGRDQAGSDVGA